VFHPSRRDLLKTGLAAVPGAALTHAGFDRFGIPTFDQGAPRSASPQAYAGFPDPASQWRGDSSVAAALKSGQVQKGSTLDAVARTLGRQLPPFDRDQRERTIPENPIFLPQSISARRLRARFLNLRRHFVFEYYAWYETSPYVHWSEKGHTPPYRIASTMMPALGPYDSLNGAVVEQHARWMADAGVGAIAISWWGRDSYSNRATPLIMDVMRAHDIHVTFHLEPYRTDRALFYASDVNYLLREYGERRQWDNFLLLEHADGSSAPVLKTFRTIVPPTVIDCVGQQQIVPDYTPDDVWHRQTDTIRENARPLFDRVILLADSLDVGRTRAGGFDGMSVYDSFVRPASWPQAATDFGGNDLLYSFATNCGFDLFVPVVPLGVCDLPLPFEPPIGVPVDWTSVESRRLAETAARGRILESLETTMDLQADPNRGNAQRGFFLTYLTTFNEWHEGTSFEPAKNRTDLLPQELPFNYHNPEDGAWRLNFLRSLLQPITQDR